MSSSAVDCVDWGVISSLMGERTLWLEGGLGRENHDNDKTGGFFLVEA